MSKKRVCREKNLGAQCHGCSWRPDRGLGLAAEAFSHLWPPSGGEVAPNGWIKTLPDGSAVRAMPRSEMGQGVFTALSMFAAEDLDVGLERLRLEQAGSDTVYGNVAMWVASLTFHPQELENRLIKVRVVECVVGKVARELGINATGGSSRVADAWLVLRTAVATARASLLGAASLQWRLPAAEFTVSKGVVSHPSGKSALDGELARLAAATPPGTVTLKERKDWQVIGQSVPRIDIPAKVDGTTRHGWAGRATARHAVCRRSSVSHAGRLAGRHSHSYRAG